MTIYLVIGFIIAIIYKNRFKIKNPNNNIPSYLGDILGFSIIAFIWPLSLIKILSSLKN